MPFLGTKERLYECVCEGKLYLNTSRWQYISDHAKDLVRQMLTVSAEERITVEEALNHRLGINIVNLMDSKVIAFQMGAGEREICTQDPSSRDSRRA